jgi:hypothetical protein
LYGVLIILFRLSACNLTTEVQTTISEEGDQREEDLSLTQLPSEFTSQNSSSSFELKFCSTMG